MTDQEKQEIRQHLKDYADSRLQVRKQTDKSTWYVCPFCGSGNKENHTEAFTIQTGSVWYKCFSCGESGDIFDLINKIEFSGGLDKKRDFPILVDKAQELYGTQAPAAPAQSRPAAPEKPKHTEKPAQIQKRLKQYLASCHALAGETNYFSERGLTPETVSRFNLGYDQKRKAAVIPNDTTGTDLSYTARLLYPTPRTKYLKEAGTDCGIFNPAALRDTETPCFVCEGAINAMSIMQAAGENTQAIATNGASEWRKFINQIDKLQSEGTGLPVFILALDEDTAGTGNTHNIAEELEKRNLPYIRAEWRPATEETGKDYPDSNDRLLHTPAQFKADIKANIDRAAAAADEAQQETIEKIHALRGSQKIRGLRDRAANNIAIPTGFKSLDQLLYGGLYPGLYVLGAGSSLGKTTFALQIADQAAQSGRPVLFISLEQSADELICKSLSRLTYQICKKDGIDESNAKTARDLLTPREYNSTEAKLIQRAEDFYTSYGDNLYIYEADRHHGITVAAIGEIIKDTKRVCRQAPIVIIDYLQILAAPESSHNLTDKQIADINISQLYKTARDFRTPVIALSSVNRASYNQKSGMQSLKESGSIEYSADVIISLDPAKVQISNSDTENAKEMYEHKKQEEREISVTILKQRLGKTNVSVDLKYFAKFNFLDDTNAPITIDEIPDDLPF